MTKSLPFFLEFAAEGVEVVGARVPRRAARLRARADDRRSATARTTSTWSHGAVGSAVENAERAGEGGRAVGVPVRGRRGRRSGARGASRLTRVIDLRAARSDPDRFRAALARKGAAERFDALLAADERWRELVPRVDELRGRLKLKGKPTPEQLEELNRVKEELRAAEEELAAAEAERDALLEQVPNPPDPSAPDGDDRRGRRGAPPRRRARAGRAPSTPRSAASRWSAPRGSPASRFGYLVGDTALLALALYRFAIDRAVAHGHTPLLPPVLVREEAMYGTGFFPTERSNIYALEADEPLPDRAPPRSRSPGCTWTRSSTSCRSATRRSRRASAASRAPPGRTRAACSASTSSTRSSCSSSASRSRSGEEHDRAARDRGGARPGARPPVPRRQRRRRRPRRLGGEEVRHRGVVPAPAALPGDHLDLEHDRLPGAPARDPLPAGREARRDAAHAQRHRGHRPLACSRSSRTSAASARTCSRRSARPRG